ncbi:MAG TPA: PDZ domain-containing protein [Blastocatellia bacterium]|nr:PDZ domain-containing protein [Blastocatellia bacterium]
MRFPVRSFTVMLALLFCAAEAAGTEFKHYPAASRTHIAFVYANDIWCAPKEGGAARALTNAPGMKYNPRFSPDGRTIAFVANLEGNQDIYTVAIEGGAPKRITHLPRGKALCQWTAAGELLFYTNALSFNPLAMQLFSVRANGGMPARLPVTYGADGSMSADGQYLAYTQNWPNTLMNTWKRYAGGMAQDIWLFNLRTQSSKRLTDWKGTDQNPMWHGETLYYISDAGPEHRHNIWALDIKTGERRQVTRFTDYDVKNPSVGPGRQGEGEIVFQYAADLYTLDLATHKSSRVDVVIPQENRVVKSVKVNAADFMVSLSAAPFGDRVAVEARGDIWTLSSANKPAINLTRTGGVFERDPAFSPDGKWVAYFADSTGEYELYVARSDGSGDVKQLTRTGPGFRYRPLWSPDSGKIAFIDQSNAVYVHTIGSGETKRIDADEWGERPQLSWSSDSRLLAYTLTKASSLSTVWVYNTDSAKAVQVTSGMSEDFYPAFDRKGDYLYFVSTRNFSSPTLNPFNNNFVYRDQDTIVAIDLRQQPRTMEDVERSATRLPVQAWNIRNLGVAHDGKLVYARSDMAFNRSIVVFDPSGQKEKTIVEAANDFSLSPDGKYLATRKGTEITIHDLAGDQKTAVTITAKDMQVEIDARAEWRQIFNDIWRLYRDFFYDPGMHGVDWTGIRERYGKWPDACVTREDLNYVLGEMIGEISVGHAYMSNSGDTEKLPPAVSVGLLGADFELKGGAYRITKIYEGARWDTNARGPLSQPGVKVKAGDYLIAVDGKPVDVSKDPWAAFQGLANREVTLTLSNKPVADAIAWQITVKPLADENNLRYLAWVEANRSLVDKQTGGKVGYIHLPDVSINGLNAMVRQLYGQVDKDGLIVDARWSAGGFLGDIFANLMDPASLNYLGGRYSLDRPVPWRYHRGPKRLIVSGMTVSAGENFAYYFRKLGRGKIIGSRTWGGLIGLNGNPALIDGGYFNIPNAPFFEDNGTWMIEGYGIDPDVEVIGDPGGSDQQLDAAIKDVVEEIKRRPVVKPRRPPYADRSRMGIKEADK